jgi:hypothetical protein
MYQSACPMAALLDMWLQYSENEIFLVCSYWFPISFFVAFTLIHAAKESCHRACLVAGRKKCRVHWDAFY